MMQHEPSSHMKIPLTVDTDTGNAGQLKPPPRSVEGWHPGTGSSLHLHSSADPARFSTASTSEREYSSSPNSALFGPASADFERRLRAIDMGDDDESEDADRGLLLLLLDPASGKLVEEGTNWRREKKRRKWEDEMRNRQLVSSVFEPYPIHHLPISYGTSVHRKGRAAKPLESQQIMTAGEFLDVLESVRVAIRHDIQPKRISQGSSGSYFCRDRRAKTVGVYKPKNEEPYGKLNPKWTKWLHRHLFPCFFGRSCLIPNLGYMSEAGASLIDRRLDLGLVPRTEVVSLSSPAFYYPKKDRRAARRRKDPVPLPPKIGSFQIFMDGYTDASTFLRVHPWPRQPISLLQQASPSSSVVSRTLSTDTNLARTDDFQWTYDLQYQFRLQLERLVIFDYLIRNTDRGSDNWMVRVSFDQPSTDDQQQEEPSSAQNEQTASTQNERAHSSPPQARIYVAAIDNGLAFPFKHPDEWRSYPYGWLFLPASLIDQPFSPETRAHFLPLLSSPDWWLATVAELHRLFSVDDDFNQGMFERQMAVLKGQGWNIVESLKRASEGPFELCQRQPVMVWEEEVTKTDEELGLMAATHSDAISPSAPPNISGYGGDDRNVVAETSKRLLKQLRSKFTLDSGGAGSSSAHRTRRIMERLETVHSYRPCFTMC